MGDEERKLRLHQIRCLLNITDHIVNRFVFLLLHYAFILYFVILLGIRSTSHALPPTLCWIGSWGRDWTKPFFAILLHANSVCHCLRFLYFPLNVLFHTCEVALEMEKGNACRNERQNPDSSLDLMVWRVWHLRLPSAQRMQYFCPTFYVNCIYPWNHHRNSLPFSNFLLSTGVKQKHTLFSAFFPSPFHTNATSGKRGKEIFGYSTEILNRGIKKQSV